MKQVPGIGIKKVCYSLSVEVATLRRALLVDALGLKLLGGKPPHHGKVSFNRGGAAVLSYSSAVHGTNILLITEKLILEWFPPKEFYKLPVNVEKKSWRFPYFCKSYCKRKIGKFLWVTLCYPLLRVTADLTLFQVAKSRIYLFHRIHYTKVYKTSRSILPFSITASGPTTTLGPIWTSSSILAVGCCN